MRWKNMACWRGFGELHDSKVQEHRSIKRQNRRWTRERYRASRVMKIEGLVIDSRLAMAKELDLSDGIVYITDMEAMVNIMAANIGLNQSISRIEARELDWYFIWVSAANWRAAPIPEDLASPDIVLAADCVYFEPAFPLLQETLRRLTEGRNVDVYMAYKKRRKVHLSCNLCWWIGW